MSDLTPLRTAVASFSRHDLPPTSSSSAPLSPGADEVGVGGGGDLVGAAVHYDDGAFDPSVYVLHVASSSSSSPGVLSCALSDRSVRVYDPKTLSVIRTFRDVHGAAAGAQHGGEAAISDLCHASAPGSSGEGDDLVVTSGADGLVRLFDVRAPCSPPTSSSAAYKGSNGVRVCSGAALEFCLPRSEGACSHSIGYGGALAAVGGSRGSVHFYDLRCAGGGGGGGGGRGGGGEGHPLGTYEDAHTDAVNRIRFQPSLHRNNQPGGGAGATTSMLATASEDGLLNVYDTSHPTEDLALQSICNLNVSIRDVTFFGPQHEGILCLTGSETAQVWHWDAAQPVCDYGGDVLRANLSRSAGAGYEVEFLVGAFWDWGREELSLLGGNADGRAAVFRLNVNDAICTHRLGGRGHRGCVRAATAMTMLSGMGGRGRVLVTGGEDAQLCQWDIDGRQGTTCGSSSLSPTLPVKVQHRGGPRGEEVGRERRRDGETGTGGGGGPTRRAKRRTSCMRVATAAKGAPY